MRRPVARIARRRRLHPAARAVAEQRHRRRREAHRREPLGEGGGGGAHERRVVRAVERQRAALDALRLQRRRRRRDGGRLAREHLPPRRVAHGEPQLPRRGGGGGGGGVGGRGDGEHRPLRRLLRQPRARGDERERVGLGEDAGERRSDEFADRVAADGGDVDAQVDERAAEGELGDEDGGLRDGGRIEGGAVRLRLLERRRRVELLAEVEAEERQERLAHPVDVGAEAGLAAVQPLAHPRALRPLPREDEQHARRRLRAAAAAAAVGERRRRLAEPRRRLRGRAGDDGEAAAEGLAAEVQRVRGARELIGRRAVGPRRQRLGAAAERSRRLGGDGEHVRAALGAGDHADRRVGGGDGGRRRRLLEHHVHVGAADPEGRDAGAARRAAGGRRPRRGAAVVDEEGGAVEHDLRVELAVVGGGD